MLFIAFVVGYLAVTSAAPFKEGLVYPELLQERSTNGELLLRIKHTTLRLKKSSVLSQDLFLGTDVGDEVEYTLWNGTSLEENLFHDSGHQSSVMLQQSGRSLNVEGMLSPSWRIAPLLSLERSSNASTPHRVYRIQDTHHTNDVVFRNLDINNPVHRNRRKTYWRPPRETLPREYVAEIHLISDRRHQEQFEKNRDLIVYLAILMNAVNLWYEGMKEPRIRTKIVGISRMKNPKNEVQAGRYLNGKLTLTKFTKYVQRKLPREPDAIYVFTEHDLAAVSPTGVTNGNLAGLAMLASLCTPINVGLGEDTAGTFKGTYAAAHEIAHILGSAHDGGEGAPWIPNNAGGEPCSWRQGYLMSYVDGGLKKYQLSSCSKAQIRGLIRIIPDKCLAQTSPISLKTRRKILPGQTMTAEDYCRGILADKGGGVLLQEPDELENCRMKCCVQTSFGAGLCQKEYVPNGMPCGRGKTCRKGVCGRHRLKP